MNKKIPISYSAVVLDDRSKRRLEKHFNKYIPDDWKVYMHHMTINLGEIKPELERYIGFPVRLKVESFGMDDMVAAVGVSGFHSENENPHITLAINYNRGAKPRMSNDIEDWEQMKRPIMITGKVTEIPLDVSENLEF